ncbi:MAG TPA: DUF4392 domain-containing protein [Spirochaetia bacterium]|nr:DUF4392 domain-containing protein [Spirochaetales bacterium]HRW23653.1 DUF4392 domain-containing protein [Spirochaetia bacterium]
MSVSQKAATGPTSIEAALADDPGGRGLCGDPRLRAALRGAIRRAASGLARADRVLIVTGFLIERAGVGESDGPPGAAVLARALARLGKDVRIVTDGYSAALVEAAAAALGERPRVQALSPADGEAACVSILADFRPDVVVSVERPGKAADGGFYSMRGSDMRALVPDADALVARAADHGAVSVAVGDGGNELGMGSIGAIIDERVPLGPTIKAVTSADELIVAGVSNWGAYALVRAIELLLRDQGRTVRLLHGPGDETAMLEAVAAAGGVDGCSGRREPTVDGVSPEADLAALEAIRAATSIEGEGNPDD